MYTYFIRESKCIWLQTIPDNYETDYVTVWITSRAPHKFIRGVQTE